MTQKKKILKDRIKYFLLGVVLVLSTLILIGATEFPAPNYGRYQISAWGDHLAHGAFIVDTITGETKIAYRYKTTGDSRGIERNFLNVPFPSID